MANIDPILTPKFRARWTNLAEPDDKGKFSVTMLFPEGTDLKALKGLIIAAIKDKWGDKFKPAQLVLPLKDGNDKVNTETGEVYAEYVDTTWATASTKFAVTVLDGTRGKKPIPAAELKSAVYDGCWMIAQVSAYGWEFKDDKSGKVIRRGVGFQLENLLKYADDEQIGGGGKKFKAEDAFADIEADSDNPDNYEDQSEDGWDL